LSVPAPQPADSAATQPASHVTAAGPIGEEGLAFRDCGSQVRLWTVVVAGLALDLWSKQWAFATLRQGGGRVLIPRILEFHTTLNPGALFGIGAGRTGLFLLASLLALILVLWMFAHCPARRRLTHIALGAILAGALGNMYDRVFVRLTPYVYPTPTGRAVAYGVRDLSPDGQYVVLREYPPDDRSRVVKLPVSAAGDLPPEAGYVRDFIKIRTTLPNWSWLPDRLRGREAWPWVFNVADMLLVGGVGILAIRMLRDHRAGTAGRRGTGQQPDGASPA